MKRIIADCSDCFKPLAPALRCPHCGFEPQHTASNISLLPPFTPLTAGRYLTGRVLGQPGGFGVVYAGLQTGLSRLVAIKEFFPHTVNRLAERAPNSLEVIPASGHRELFNHWRQQFLAEARLLANLQHPHIVAVHDILEEHGTVYLIMERLYGVTLAELGRRLTSEEAMTLLLATLEALEFLHRRPTGPIIHLDLTPNNLFLVNHQPSQLTLLDFGLARDSGNAQDYSPYTGVGNPAFMAPEQVETMDYTDISPAADCYSLGACLYAALTGLTLPSASSRRAGAQLLDLTTQLPDINPALARVITTCLNLDPVYRPQDASHLRQQLAGATIILPASLSTKGSELAQNLENPLPQPVEALRTSVEAKQRLRQPRSRIFNRIFTGILILILITLLATIIKITWRFVQCTVSHPVPYQIHDDGTVTDNSTGLMWKRCSEGQVWNGTVCTGQAIAVTWDIAMPNGRQKPWGEFAQYNDWRLPTIEELRILVRCSNGTPQQVAWDNLCTGQDEHKGISYQSPTINTDIFPNTPKAWFWSASVDVTDVRNARVVYFTNGGAYWTNRSNTGFVRLVRKITTRGYLDSYQTIMTTNCQLHLLGNSN